MKIKLQRTNKYGSYFYEFKTTIKPEQCISKKEINNIAKDLKAAAIKLWDEAG